MRDYHKIIGSVLCLAVFALGACQVLQQDVAPYAKKAIDAYCGVPSTARDAIRTAVDAAVAPNQIAVTCAIPAGPAASVVAAK